MANVFSAIEAEYINDLTLRKVLTDDVRENIFQGLFTRNGEGVTEQFSKDTDAAVIQVLRVIPHTNDAREIGADTNGGWFNSLDAVTSSTEAYAIHILQAIDRNIDIPLNAQNMIPVNLAAAESKNLAGLVNRNINAATIAAYIAKNFNNIAGFDKPFSGAETSTITAVDSNWITLSTNYTDAIIDAAAKLDDGNADAGVDAYPDDFRAVYIRPTIKAEILKNMTGLYGGTSVFSVLKSAGLDTETKPSVAVNGYVGEIANMPVYVASGIVWKLAESYLGLDEGALDSLAAVVVSGYGTGRALAFNSEIKTIDAPSGQGLRLQPKYRYGVECWDALSVVPVFSAAFTNPVTTSSTALYVRGKASR